MEKEGEDLSSLGKDLMQMVEELENLAKARRSLENDVVAARHSLAKERYSSLDKWHASHLCQKTLCCVLCPCICNETNIE